MKMLEESFKKIQTEVKQKMAKVEDQTQSLNSKLVSIKFKIER